MSTLIEAIVKNQVQEALKLLKNEDIQRDMKSNYDAFTYALKNCQLPIALNLLKIKAFSEDISKKAKEGDIFILIDALSAGCLPVILKLLTIPAVAENVGSILNNIFLRDAIGSGKFLIFFEALKIPNVIENAAVLNNRCLNLAAKIGNLPMLLALLKIPAVSQYDGGKHTDALFSAVIYGHLPLVIELLKMPAVLKNAASDKNSTLRNLIELEPNQTNLILELLKVEKIRDQLNVNHHEILKGIIKANHLGIANIVFNLYVEKKIPIPRDLLAKFENAKKALKRKEDMKSKAALVMAIYKNDSKEVFSLLQDKNVKNIAETENNLALYFAVFTGNLNLVDALLKLKNVRDTIQNENAIQILDLAIKYGDLELISRLLQVDSILKNIIIEDNWNKTLSSGLFLAIKEERWLCVIKFLQINSVIEILKNKPDYSKELLKGFIYADQLSMLLSVLLIYKEKEIPIPMDMWIPFGDTCIDLSTFLTNNLKKAKEEASEVFNAATGSRWEPGVTEMIFGFANMSSKSPEKSTFIESKKTSDPTGDEKKEKKDHHRPKT